EAGLAPLWRAPTLDTVVLGCTHFPLLRDLLNARAPRPVQWVDSGSAIARRVAQVAADESGGGVSGLSWATGSLRPGLQAGLATFGFAVPTELSAPAIGSAM
ncbi:MAG: glutamate racemase, partial [Alloalcanivorax venustensis]